MSYAEDYVKRLQQIQTARMIGQLTSQPANKADFANLILQKARSDWSVQYPSGPPAMPDNSKHGPGSFALGLLDKLSRPLYAVAEAADVAFNGPDNQGPDTNIGDILQGAKRGITGKDQTSFIDVLQNQKIRDIKKSPEYLDTLKNYGQKEADWYEQTQKDAVLKNDIGTTVGGLLSDFAFDPLNLVPVAGPLAHSVQAVRRAAKLGTGLSKAATESDAVLEASRQLGRETSNVAQPAGTEAATSAGKLQVPTLSPDVLDKLKAAQGADQQVSFPSITGKFGSNRRPPVKTVEGQKVSADYSGTIADSLRQQPRFANLTDVFKRDLRQKDFEGLQQTRIHNETAQVVDQVHKGNPAAVDLITNKNIEPLAPVARSHVDQAVNHTIREISQSISDPAKAKAAGKQPRWPVFNAPTQNNLSNRISNSAKNIFNVGRSGQVPDEAFVRYKDMLKNAEESLIHKGRAEKNDAFYPRGGIKPNSPYLRLSDVLEALPPQLAKGAIFGSKTEKILPSVLLKAVTGNNAALGKIASSNRALFDAIQNVDWTPLMVKEYATRTIDSANAAHEATNTVAGFISAKFADETASDVNKAAVMDATVKAAKNEFKNEMPEAKSTLGDMLDGLRKSIPNPLPDPIDVVIERGKQKLAAGVFSAGNGQKIAQAPRIATAKAVIEDAVGPVSETAIDLYKAEAAAENGIFSTVLKWFDPASGYKDLRPLVLKNISARKTSATTRAHEIIKVFQQIPENQHLDYWKEVIGAIPPTTEHAAPVAMMQKMLQNLFGDSGLAEKFAGNTAIARAGINVDHLNKHLRIVGVKDFKFTRDVPDPLDPTKTIHLNPDQVLDTWKNYIPESSKNLRQFVFNLSQAVENSMVEYSTFANLGALYGSKTGGAGKIAVSGMHAAIDGMHFPKEMVSQIAKMSRGIDDMYEPVATSELMKIYDIGLRTWKTGVTIYAPSHHIRNMIGDMFTSWLDGMNNPMYYTKSGWMIKANYHRYSDIKVGKNPLSDILGSNREAEVIGKILGQSKEQIPKGSRVIVTAKIKGKKYPITIDQAYQMAFRQGIFPHSSIVEDLPGSETLMEAIAQKYPKVKGVVQPFGGNVAKGVKGLAETREHFVRGGHWLWSLEHTKANSLEELFQKAGDRVRKYHPDGLDLTLTEKRVMRRLIPFYSWNRKAIPLIIEGIVMHPAKIMAYPKIMSAMQEYQGIDSSTSDPWPDDQLFPDWLSSKIIGPVIPPDSGFAKAIARSPQEVGYGIVNPSNPANDILEQFFNDPVKGVGNSLTPALKIPAEVMTGHEIQTGAPIQDKTQYIDKNVPMLSILSRVTNGAVGTGILEGGDLKGKETSPQNLPALINLLTAAGIIDTGRYTKGGEFDLRARLAQQKKDQQNGAK